MKSLVRLWMGGSGYFFHPSFRPEETRLIWCVRAIVRSAFPTEPVKREHGARRVAMPPVTGRLPYGVKPRITRMTRIDGNSSVPIRVIRGSSQHHSPPGGELAYSVVKEHVRKGTSRHARLYSIGRALSTTFFGHPPVA